MKRWNCLLFLNGKEYFPKQRDLEVGSKAVDVLHREKYTAQDRKKYAKPGLVIQLVENKCSRDMLELYSN